MVVSEGDEVVVPERINLLSELKVATLRGGDNNPISLLKRGHQAVLPDSKPDNT
jgi:hypothetical protein